MSGKREEKAESEITLEEAFGQLEQIIEQLESEDIPLEKSFEIYKEGMELLQFCNSTLDNVEKKVLTISESGELNEF